MMRRLLVCAIIVVAFLETASSSSEQDEEEKANSSPPPGGEGGGEVVWWPDLVYDFPHAGCSTPVHIQAGPGDPWYGKRSWCRSLVIFETPPREGEDDGPHSPAAATAAAKEVGVKQRLVELSIASFCNWIALDERIPVRMEPARCIHDLHPAVFEHLSNMDNFFASERSTFERIVKHSLATTALLHHHDSSEDTDGEAQKPRVVFHSELGGEDRIVLKLVLKSFGYSETGDEHNWDLLYSAHAQFSRSLDHFHLKGGSISLFGGDIKDANSVSELDLGRLQGAGDRRQVHNHCLTQGNPAGNKAALHANFKKMIATLSATDSPPASLEYGTMSVPETFVIPEEFDELMVAMAQEGRADDIWIYKPSTAQRGTGIFLFRDQKDLLFRHSFSSSGGAADQRQGAAVVQRYVSAAVVIDPRTGTFLQAGDTTRKDGLQGHKFHIRLFMVIVSLDPLFVLAHRSGFVAFAEQPFSTHPSNDHNVRSHTTENVANERMWSLEQFWAALENSSDYGPEERTNLQSKLSRALTRVALSVDFDGREKGMYERYGELRTPGTCFDFWAVDLVLDNVDGSLTPWVIDVNLAPVLAFDNALIEDKMAPLPPFLSQKEKQLTMARVVSDIFAVVLPIHDGDEEADSDSDQVLAFLRATLQTHCGDTATTAGTGEESCLGDNDLLMLHSIERLRRRLRPEHGLELIYASSEELVSLEAPTRREMLAHAWMRMFAGEEKRPQLASEASPLKHVSEQLVVVIGGIGGSGTRSAVTALREAGVFTPSSGGQHHSLDFNAGEEHTSAWYAVRAQQTADWRWEALDGSHRASIIRLQREGLRRLHRLYSARARDGPIGFKHGPTMFLIPLLHALLGDRLVFLHIVRDGRDVALSANRKQLARYGASILHDSPAIDWSNQTDVRVNQLRFWARANAQTERCAQRLLRPANYFRLNAEDLVVDGVLALSSLLDRLGVDWRRRGNNAASADFYRFCIDDGKQTQSLSHTGQCGARRRRWETVESAAAVDINSAGKWQHYDPEEIGAILRDAGQEARQSLQQFGYDLAD